MSASTRSQWRTAQARSPAAISPNWRARRSSRTLPSVPGNVQNGTWVWGADTGAANAYVVTVPYPVTPAYVAGLGIKFKAANANSGPSTVNLNSLGAVAIKRAGGAALNTGDILSGQVVELTYDGVNFQMANYLGLSAGTTTNNFTNANIPYVADTGAANALVATYSPAVTSGQQIAGLFLSVKLANHHHRRLHHQCQRPGREKPQARRPHQSAL